LIGTGFAGKDEVPLLAENVLTEGFMAIQNISKYGYILLCK